MMEEIDYMRLIAHVKFKSTSPIVFQKPISKPNFLSEIAQSRWQKTVRGRCNYLNRRGKDTGQWRFCRSKFKIILRFRNEKTILTGAVAQKITAALVTLLL